jgi:hypothetical protein
VPDVPADRRDAVLAEWLARTLETYPQETSRFLRGVKDQFRNPVGHIIRDGLQVLVDELFGAMDRARILPALDGIVRIRAVQDFSASQAVAFVFLLKKILRHEAAGEELERLEARVDDLALAAFDVFMQCREKICEIRVEEARRRYAMYERAFPEKEV